MRIIINIIIGLLLSGLVLFYSPIENNLQANQTLAVAVLMIYFWVSNVMHFALTSLIPIVIFPFFKIVSLSELSEAYLNRIVFLFIGGFLIAAAIQKWYLHKRIALHIILSIGTDMKKLILGFMVSSAFLSMWVSNTATTMLMLPIGLSVIGYIKEHNHLPIDNPFPTALMLGIAYASSIGGMATIIGTAPNALTAAFLFAEFKLDTSFLEWMILGLPLVIVAIPLSYMVMTRLAFKFPNDISKYGEDALRLTLSDLGKMKQAERILCVVFILVVIGWVIQPILFKIHPLISDALIALVGGGGLFLLPARKNEFILTWRDLFHIPWSVIILIGGGLALAIAVKSSGLAQQIASLFYVAKDVNFAFLLLFIIITIVTLSEFTSNTATTATFIPILATVATELHYNPILLIIPATFAASCAFMLPIATPPNAIVFSSGQITMPQMSRAGFYLNIFFVILLFIYGMSLYLCQP